MTPSHPSTDELVELVRSASWRHRDELVSVGACDCRPRCTSCSLRLAASSDALLSALDRLEQAQVAHELAPHR